MPDEPSQKPQELSAEAEIEAAVENTKTESAPAEVSWDRLQNIADELDAAYAEGAMEKAREFLGQGRAVVAADQSKSGAQAPHPWQQFFDDAEEKLTPSFSLQMPELNIPAGATLEEIRAIANTRIESIKEQAEKKITEVLAWASQHEQTSVSPMQDDAKAQIEAQKAIIEKESSQS